MLSSVGYLRYFMGKLETGQANMSDRIDSLEARVTVDLTRGSDKMETMAGRINDNYEKHSDRIGKAEVQIAKLMTKAGLNAKGS